MKINKMLVCAVALVGWSLVGCGGVEGTYTIDKPETKKAMEEDIKKLPADEQKFAQLGLALMDSMDMTLELKKDGTATMKTTMPSLDGKAGKTEEETGTWKKDGDSVILTQKGKDTKCTKSGKKLTCSEPSSDGKTETVVFDKT